MLQKKRFSGRHVKVKLKEEIDVRGKNVIIVDDIISTGGTVAGAARLLKEQKPKRIAAVCVHGLFVEDALAKMKKAGIASIACTNTIKGRYAQIDATSLIADALR